MRSVTQETKKHAVGTNSNQFWFVKAAIATVAVFYVCIMSDESLSTGENSFIKAVEVLFELTIVIAVAAVISFPLVSSFLQKSGRAPPPPSQAKAANLTEPVDNADREAAEMRLQRISEAENEDRIIDGATYISGVLAAAKVGDVRSAERFLRRMKESGFQPTEKAYCALARAYADQGKWKEVERLALDLEMDGFEVSPFFLYIQLICYATATPRSFRAEHCFRLAAERGVLMNEHVVFALKRAVGRERAEDLLKELSPIFGDGNGKSSKPKTGGEDTGSVASEWKKMRGEMAETTPQPQGRHGPALSEKYQCLNVEVSDTACETRMWTYWQRTLSMHN